MCCMQKMHVLYLGGKVAVYGCLLLNKKKQRKCMYTFDSRIRYSETDETGALSLLGVINYLQDCSTFQSEDIGLGVEYL